MRKRIGTFALIASLAVTLVASPSASYAAITELIVDFSESTLGSITFPTLTGDSDVGVLLSFDGFTQTDITSISWTLDASTHDVAALDLNALQGQADCSPSLGTACSNRTLNLTRTAAGESSIFCTGGERGLCGRSGSERSVAYVPTAVPEPSTWAMMLLGFAGLCGLSGVAKNRRGLGRQPSGSRRCSSRRDGNVKIRQPHPSV
jgi:PEP-CTERM motif